MDFELLHRELAERGLESALRTQSMSKGIDPIMIPLAEVFLLKGYPFHEIDEGRPAASERELILWMDMNYGTDMRIVGLPQNQGLSIDAHTLQPRLLPFCISPSVELNVSLAKIKALAKAVHYYRGPAHWLVATSSACEPFETRVFADYLVPLRTAQQSIRPLAEHLYRRL